MDLRVCWILVYWWLIIMDFMNCVHVFLLYLVSLYKSSCREWCVMLFSVLKKWKVCSEETKNLVNSSFETRVVDLEFSGFIPLYGFVILVLVLLLSLLIRLDMLGKLWGQRSSCCLSWASRTCWTWRRHPWTGVSGSSPSGPTARTSSPPSRVSSSPPSTASSTARSVTSFYVTLIVFFLPVL